MNIDFDYINPLAQYRILKNSLLERKYFARYKAVVQELADDGKLETMGLSHDADGNMYLGINLNPEILVYEDASQEAVELNMIKEKLKQHTHFLTVENIIDSVIMDYDRVRTVDYYGYVLRIRYAFKQYTKKKYLYSVGYFCTLSALVIAGIVVGSLFL